MSWIQPIEMNMNISRTVLEGKWDNALLDLIQKVAIYTLVPFMLIAAFEGVVKNLIGINLANFGIGILNSCHDLYMKFCVPT